MQHDSNGSFMTEVWSLDTPFDRLEKALEREKMNNRTENARCSANVNHQG